MRIVKWMWIGLAASAWCADSGDASRGAVLLESQRCNSCHRFNGLWDTDGLTRLFKTRLTPSRLVGAIWGHAPAIWGAARKSGATPAFGDQQAADLLAYFFAAGYFEPIGDARRGELKHVKLRCSSCHPAEQVRRWNVIANPVALLHSMWQHAPRMKEALTKRVMSWPSLSTEDMSDLLAHVAAQTDRENHTPRTAIGTARDGVAVFQSSGCANCHSNEMALGRVPMEHSLTELAASLWTHSPMMIRTPAPLTPADVASLLAYLWSVRFFDEPGNAARGNGLLAAKGCESCHADPAARRPLSTAAALRAVWKHQEVWRENRSGVSPWPKFLGTEMADLIACWNLGENCKGSPRAFRRSDRIEHSR